MSKPESDVPFHPACSRRVFLEKTLVGAASVARGIGYSARPIGIAMLNAAAVTAADDLANLQLHEAATLVRQKKVSPVQLTQACIARIEALNPRLNAFITSQRNRRSRKRVKPRLNCSVGCGEGRFTVSRSL